MDHAQRAFLELGVALAIGLLIGIERGSAKRDIEEGERVAGVRTYGLTGLLGGAVAMLAQQYGPLVLAIAFVGACGVFGAAYVANVQGDDRDVGITSLIASLLTFALGAMAVSGRMALAAAAAVVTTLLLTYKPQLHRWVATLNEQEVRAGIKLLLLSVVLLPVLPNRGFGPWEVLNPYAIWWMVVLIAGVSFAGYFAIRLAGARSGIAFTGLFGGLASSTATTLHLARVAREDASLAPALSTGILLACSTMVPRVVGLVAIINPGMVMPMLIPAGAMVAVFCLPALVYWRVFGRKTVAVETTLRNPLDLPAALGFGVLLAVILLLVRAVSESVGDSGVLALAALSGAAKMDAITLSLARMSGSGLDLRIAVLGLFIAAATNSLVKAGMAGIIGGRRLGLYTGIPLAAGATVGLLLAWMTG